MQCKTTNPEIRVSKTSNEMCAKAARSLIRMIQTVLEEQHAFSLFLAGGSTPLPLYQTLAEEGDSLPWSRIHFFWSDERFVPSHHDNSNYSAARQRLFSKIDIPDSNIHRVPTEMNSPEITARMYEREVQNVFEQQFRTGQFQPDLVLLGLGADGHTAGLHPGHPVLYEGTRTIAAVDPSNLDLDQAVITLTASAINQSSNVWILAAGQHKRDAVTTTINTPEKAQKQGLPVASIQPEGTLVWHVDQEAYGGP